MLTSLLFAAAFAAEPAFLYSTRSDNHVRVVGTTDLHLHADIAAGVGCHELAVSPDARWAIGSAYGGPGKGHQPADNRLVVMNLVENTVHRTITLEGLHRPNDIAFLPGSSEAIVTVEVPPHLVRVHAETGAFTKIPLERQAGHMLALAPDGMTAYVAHVMPGLVSVVDLAAGKVVATITVKAGAEGIACSPDGARLWVACNRSNAIVIIDTAKREVVQTLDAPGFPFRLRFAPDGKTVAVSFPMTAEVGFYDAAKPETVTRVSVKDEAIDHPGSPTSIAFSADGAALAVVCDGPHPQLVRIDARAHRVTERMDTPATPDALAAAPARPDAPAPAGAHPGHAPRPAPAPAG